MIQIYPHNDKKLVISRFHRHFRVYEFISKQSGVPIDVIVAIHYRESSFNFTGHLVNGDSLKARTIRVPKNFPAELEPPYSFEESAIIGLKTFYWKPKFWSFENKLEFCERWNGLGYRNKGLKSPYMWAGTSEYIGGMFTSDGKFSADKKDERLGCYAILRILEEGK